MLENSVVEYSKICDSTLLLQEGTSQKVVLSLWFRTTFIVTSSFTQYPHFLRFTLQQWPMPVLSWLRHFHSVQLESGARLEFLFLQLKGPHPPGFNRFTFFGVSESPYFSHYNSKISASNSLYFGRYVTECTYFQYTNFYLLINVFS